MQGKNILFANEGILKIGKAVARSRCELLQKSKQLGDYTKVKQ